jgi:hypothetical protein
MPTNDSIPLTIDKSFFSVSSLEDCNDEKAYWLAKSHTERLAALELTRQIIYGYDPSTTRLQRFFEVTELK